MTCMKSSYKAAKPVTLWTTYSPHIEQDGCTTSSFSLGQQAYTAVLLETTLYIRIKQQKHSNTRRKQPNVFSRLLTSHASSGLLDTLHRILSKLLHKRQVNLAPMRAACLTARQKGLNACAPLVLVVHPRDKCPDTLRKHTTTLGIGA